jgi:hypothetical protein
MTVFFRFFNGTQHMLRIDKNTSSQSFLPTHKLRLRKQYQSNLKSLHSRTTNLPIAGTILLYASLELLLWKKENIVPDGLLLALYFDHFSVLVCTVILVLMPGQSTIVVQADLDNSDNEDDPGKEANNMLSAQTPITTLGRALPSLACSG